MRPTAAVFVPAFAVGLTVGVATIFAAPEAHAFCRSTTCRPTAQKPCETDDEGCPETGAKLFWTTSCISYATNRIGTQFMDPVDTRAVIQKAFRNWSDVACPDGRPASMTFQEREPIECKRSEYNKAGPNVNVVLFQDDDWRYRGIDGTLAKTSVTYNDTTGEIYDADIEINTAFNEVTITDDETKVQYDLLSILTHEVGHFVGIAHSGDSTAVMYASYAPGSTEQRALGSDDVDAVCAAYPPENGVACNTEPRGGFSATCPEEPPPETCAVAGGSNARGRGPLVPVGALVAMIGLVSRGWLRRTRPGKKGRRDATR